MNIRKLIGLARNPAGGRDASYAFDPPPTAGDPCDLSFLSTGLFLHEG